MSAAYRKDDPGLAGIIPEFNDLLLCLLPILSCLDRYIRA